MEDNRERLFRILKKKFETTMIFPLCQFEDCFGDLWGHGLPDSELTEDQKNNRDLWNECRTKILDNAHRQIRNTKTELNMHDVVWKKYALVFTPGNKQERQR